MSNYAYGMYSYIIQDILKLQKELESEALAITPYIDKIAVDIYKNDKELTHKFLTNYSISTAEKTVQSWKELGYQIFAKYNDRYINDMSNNGRTPKGVGYGNDFFKRAVQDKPGYYNVKWQEPKKKKK